MQTRMLFARPDRVLVAELYRSLAGEIDRLVQLGDRLQGCIGAAAMGSADPSLVEQLQTVDGLVQGLTDVMRFLDALAAVAPSSVTLDLRGLPLGAGGRASARVPLRSGQPAG